MRQTPPDNAIDQISQTLRKAGFGGDIETEFAERLIAATDNSIYQVLPAAILYPRSERDIEIAAACVHERRALGLGLCARGGGTGTNGQSLSEGLILDCGRHLNRIVDFNRDARTVTVQPGVVLDQLNDFLKPHGLFFPIDISSSSRATLGGMVATDASGTGSLIYAKTGDHIESLDLVLANGDSLHISHDGGQALADETSLIARCQRLIAPHRDEIERVFPRISRAMSGYNLQQAINAEQGFNACHLVAGAEGTLGIVSRITLRLSVRPTHQLLTVLFYDDFEQGLRHVEPLLKAQPEAIEMLDDKVLSLAQQDGLWADVQKVLGLGQGQVARAALFVQHSACCAEQIQAHRQGLEQVLGNHPNTSIILQRSETDSATIKSLWGLRKRAVGLLGRLPDGYQGIAFVEDSAVPTPRLVDYITGFRRILDEHGVEYGMYGHADAGVLHVRPALNLSRPDHRGLIRTISDQVAQLALENHGLLWGEHGRGFRGEYGPLFFGPTLYPLLQQIKQLFDPYNLLNPGKLVSIDDSIAITPLDKPLIRAAHDAVIDSESRSAYQQAVSCNGNAACLNVTPSDPMCPSYKATRNKLYSPKGRAALLREWLRCNRSRQLNDKSRETGLALLDSMQRCLSCRSCSSNCPINVDIPEYKSRFLETWYAHNRRPWSHAFSRHFETLVRVGSAFPNLSNRLLQSDAGKRLLSHLSGLVQLPLFSTAAWQGFEVVDWQSAERMQLGDNDIILLRESYLDAYDREVLLACARVLRGFGLRVLVSTPIAHGKLLHVRGMREAFARRARDVMRELQGYQRSGARLVAVETMARLLPNSEYANILGEQPKLTISSVESTLEPFITALQPETGDDIAATLFPHCQEQTAARESMRQWRTILRHLGVETTIELAGCCGMSGLFGHERANQKLSRKIFAQGWLPRLERSQGQRLATGFSCRCQLHKHDLDVQHPITLIEQRLSRLASSG
jgi:FAD/FMN-containing dehydrogenase/Fe-S oxidoreductase